MPGLNHIKCVAPLAAIALSVASGALGASNARWVEGQLLVKPRPGLPAHVFYNILDHSGGRAVDRLEKLNVHIVQVPPQAEEKVAAALARNPHIDFVEKDLLLDVAQTLPDDPYFANAWHLPVLQAPQAWQSSRGANITVAILDSGIDAGHPDLQGKFVAGWNTASNSGDTSPLTGHGTQAAGVVAALSDNALGVTSVAGQAMLMPVRVTDNSDGMAATSSIANGLIWAVDHGAKVANISYAGVLGSTTIANAAQYMVNQGGVVVCSAGNTGADPGYSNSPVMISVSATTETDEKASWSSYGNYIDVAAPGVKLWTTNSGGGYVAVSGTSFSSPVAAGVVALIMASNPDLSPMEVAAVLENSADDIGDNYFYGSGRVNAAAAVAMAINTYSVDYDAPLVSFTAPVTGSTVSGIVSIDVQASDNREVTAVSLYAAGGLVGTDTVAPYQFSWDSSEVVDGSVQLMAYATDVANNEGQSQALTVTVSNAIEAPPTEVSDTEAPSVWLLSPTDGAVVSGSVRVLVQADDDSGRLDRMQLFIDGAQVASGNAAELTYNWNTRKVSSGGHEIKVLASDASGNESQASVLVSTVSSSKGGNKRK